MTTLYISGPMTGLPEHNYPAFNEAAERLRAVGFHVLNPADAPECDTWLDYMRADLKMLADADGLVSLPGWERSRGARLEHGIAGELGLIAKPVDGWLS